MTEYGYTNEYLTRNGKPWLPVMGEIHYSRYPKKDWEQELRKMAAGGIGIVSTYVIWIHHEEVEGCYDFEGQKDLRSFAQTCAKCNLPLLLRIGPWCHGEVRNGGFPDWLMKKPFALRANSDGYLAAAHIYYQEVFSRVEGLLHKDGGPIIGIQIENEYGHAGGLCGEEGEVHMRNLTEIAKQVGFDLPYYTATGWGGAVIGDLLPVMGGYCDAPWDRSTKKLPPNVNYVFTHERNDSNIGSDRRIFDGLTFDPQKYPFLTAELGGGLQVTKHRRPVPSAADIAAMSLVKLGCGANLLGYYMYHGGTNPKGKLTTLQESKLTGSPNDLPILSYDFQAPIREYGQITSAYREIKLLAMFLADFGEKLCAMPAYLLSDKKADPSNLEDLRMSIRHDGRSGYVFINNHQRLYEMAAHPSTQIDIQLDCETITVSIPPIKNDDFFFMPFHFPLRHGRLLTAHATPLCRLNAENTDEKWALYAQGEPALRLEDEKDRKHVIMLTKEQALNAWKVKADQEYLVICYDAVWQSEDLLMIQGNLTDDIRIYPAPSFQIPQYERGADHNGWAVFHSLVQQNEESRVRVTQEADGKYTICLEQRLPADGLLEIAYVGDSAEVKIDGELVADDFYTGATWEVGLDRLKGAACLQLIIHAFDKEHEVYLQNPLSLEDRYAAKLIEAKVRPMRRTEVRF
ncbi:MAG: beta-galactosidase [Clostridiales bacterium]|nr:beta-galactosidase [Clostridiales bacterium]